MTGALPPPYRRWLLLALLAALLALAWTRDVLPSLPARHDPWAMLDVREAPNWLTGFKLWRLQHDNRLCLRALDSAGWRYVPVPDQARADGCGWTGAVRVSGGPIRIGAAPILSCPLAVSLAMVERHAIQPAAQAELDQPVVGLRHLGSYACRNVYGQPGTARSQHASANALDIAAFYLADGSRVSVQRDWSGSGRRSRFLHAVRDRACPFARGLLGPDYNAAHADHFHLDMGPYRICR